MSEEHPVHVDRIPARFRKAVRRIQQLSAAERYQAAYIFGSVARDEASTSSDLDVHVLVDRDNPCSNINHPLINGIKLDLTFLSFGQLAARTKEEIEKGDRIPMVAESTIIFDSTGELTDLRASAQRAHPKPCTRADHQRIQVGIFHANDKAKRLLDTDPPGALLVMHISLNDVVRTHYRIQGRWHVSDKRLLADLRDWDPALALMLERLVGTADVEAKFVIWTKAIDHVMAPLGGRQAIVGTNCPCAVCQQDVALLTNG